ncbi:hypothetical protein BC332_21298 [Capsicum chinense]|nr:hypothetical protein BC332_21298 [Capsicum chinense]
MDSEVGGASHRHHRSAQLRVQLRIYQTIKFTNSPTLVGEGNLKMTIDSQVHNAGTTMATTSIATISRTNTPEAVAPAENPRKFVGIDFKRNYILSGLQDDLYNMYSGTKIEKELWGVLEWKYKTEDAGTKKFFIARFLDIK